MQVISGDLDLEGLDTCKLSEQDLLKFLMGLPGVGPFTAANMMALLGHYRRIPCDSETVRHLQKAHGLHCCTQATVQADVEQVSPCPTSLTLWCSPEQSLFCRITFMH